ncbi:MAG: hypothetical protein LBN98_03620 [Prevotellaceae bacterium]|jgi:hypothetical protein|nr:hypothetical protein [Prevotellaceae bacterium]
MKILTKDNRLLYLWRIGEPDVNGCDKLCCRDEAGEKVIITWGDVLLCFGSYTF